MHTACSDLHIKAEEADRNEIRWAQWMMNHFIHTGVLPSSRPQAVKVAKRQGKRFTHNPLRIIASNSHIVKMQRNKNQCIGSDLPTTPDSAA